MLEHLLGGGARPCTGINAEAELVDEDPANFRRSSLSLSAAVHIGTLGYYASCLVRLKALFDSGKAEAVMMFQWGSFDETPMALRSKKEPGGVRTDSVALDRQAKPLKILQSDFVIGILCRPSCGEPDGSDSYELLQFPLPLPLQSLDRCTGANLVQALEVAFSVPGLHALRSCVPYVLDAYTGDRAGSNDAAIEQRTESLRKRDEKPASSIRLPCCAHIAATVQGRSFSPVEVQITGVISASLYMAQPGEIAKLEQIMQHVLAFGTEVRRGCHGQAVEWAHHRDVVLDLFLGSSVEAPGVPRNTTLRRRALGRLLTGDLAATAIVLHFDDELYTPKSWAQEVVKHLLPGVIAVFARHRWVAAYGPVAEYGLLGCVHDVLHRACVPWLQGLTTAKMNVRAGSLVIAPD